MSRERPLLAIVYDDGAASPGEIGVGLADVGEIVFLSADTAHTAALRPVMHQLGAVHLLTGDPERDLALVRCLAPDAILTFSEFMLRTTAVLAAGAELPFHDVATAEVLTDKVRQRQVLRAAGVDGCRNRPLWSPADWPDALAEVGLPAVVKPVRGGGSRHTYPVHDEQQAPQLLARIFAELAPAPPGEPLLIVEEMLVGRPSHPLGDYVSVESHCSAGGVVHLAVTGKLSLVPPFRERGRFWPTHLPDHEQRALLALVSQALAALGVRYGLTHTEVKLTPAGPRIIEVNGRLGGNTNSLSRSACGIDLVRLAALDALDAHPEPAALRPEQVHFQHNTLAPTSPCRLLAVHGAPRVRQIPGISGYRPIVRAGTDLPGGVNTHELDIFWGSCDDHAAMVRLLDRALSTLRYEFGFEDGVRTMRAAEFGA